MEKDGKKKKVKSKSSTKYETSSDEDNCSDEEDNLRTLFANLSMQQKEKLNELISVIHEKDDLLDSQEDFLIKENKKHVKVKNAYSLEIESSHTFESILAINLAFSFLRLTIVSWQVLSSLDSFSHFSTSSV